MRKTARPVLTLPGVLLASALMAAVSAQAQGEAWVSSEKDNALTLVDLKTAGRTLEQGGLERHLQLSTYALAFFLLHGSIPKLRLDMLLKTTKPRLERHLTTRTVEDLGWTARLIHEVAAAIQTEHFFPNPSWRCTECEYFAHCQQWRGTWPLPSEQLVTVSGGGGVGESVGA